MSRYNGNYGGPASSNRSPNTVHCTNIKIERQDDRASQSGSEDGNYALYGDPQRIDTELEDESNAALTSQTLNADGTPKRPMNAFMIFARRRRPQVSAENQAMRTGEISKILSKEWVSMPQSEKQFYLEQAKQLKETFNTRYPDYVYRRRPNNSRKRRRSDASGTMRPTDQVHGDQADDIAGSVDLEASPTNTDDYVDVSLPSPYSRPSYVPQSSVDQSKYGSHSRGPGHQVSSEPLFRPNGQYNSSLSSSDRIGSGLGSAASPRLSITHSGMAYPYGQSPGHTQNHPHFGAQSMSSPQGWQNRVERTNSSWLSGSHDRIPASISTQKQSAYPSASTWSSSAELPSTPSSASPSSSNYFPTLNTPFYPNQPQIPSFQSNASGTTSNSLQPPPSPSYESLGHLQSNSLTRDFTSRSYESSSISPLSYPATASRELPYSSRQLPPVQTGPVYPQPPLPPLSSGHDHPSAFWSRD